MPILHFSRYKISIWLGKAADKAYERNDLYNYVEEWETNLLSKYFFASLISCDDIWTYLYAFFLGGGVMCGAWSPYTSAKGID